MALLKNISFKWKFAVSIVVVGIILVFGYALLANHVFKTDKISYVYEVQGQKLKSTKKEIESKIDRVLLNSRSIIATYDINQAKPSEIGEEFFNKEDLLMALEVWSTKQKRSLLHLTKKNQVLPPFDGAQSSIAADQFRIEITEEGQFIVSRGFPDNDGSLNIMRALIDHVNLMPQASPTESMALIQGRKVRYVSDLRGLSADLFKEIAQDEMQSNRTRIFSHAGNRFLVSQSALDIGDISLIAITPESEALGALQTLFNRSLIFLVISIFALVIVSIFISRGLTKNLMKLVTSAERVAKGQFDIEPVIKSHDEMGLLDQTLTKMSSEISRLFSETREKARMEEELKTAKLVQERLLPQESTIEVGEIEISGSVQSSSECGGDWWYQFSRGEYVFIAIADATGHGTPAALITAAATSIFSSFEKKDLSLSQMMDEWNYSVEKCAQKEVYMTGLLVRIHCRTGEGLMLNAAHESPFLLKAQDDGSMQLEFVDADSSLRIGDGAGEGMPEIAFQIDPNDSLVLYTDGLFAVRSHDGKMLSDKRFGKALAKRAQFSLSADKIKDMTLEMFEDHRQGLGLPDDVTVVSIRRKGPDREFFLESDSGELAFRSKEFGSK